ncbi:MAG: hypothetical protein ACQES9_07510 [Myxococcota bacterium]
MKIFLSLLLILLVGTSCQNPCEKVHRKTVECAEGAGLKNSLEDQKETIMKLCAPFKDEVEECLKYEKCGEFNLCMKKATKNLIGKTKKSRQEREQKDHAEDEETSNPSKKSDIPPSTRDITKDTE